MTSIKKYRAEDWGPLSSVYSLSWQEPDRKLFSVFGYCDDVFSGKSLAIPLQRRPTAAFWSTTITAPHIIFALSLAGVVKTLNRARLSVGFNQGSEFNKNKKKQERKKKKRVIAPRSLQLPNNTFLNCCCYERIIVVASQNEYKSIFL